MVEKIFTLNLRRKFLMAPKWRRTKKAMTVLEEQIIHYTKATDVKIGRWLNEAVWMHGGKNPPGKVKVKVEIVSEKDRKIAKAELFELPSRAKREAEKLKSSEDKKKKAEAAKATKEEKEKKEEEFKKKKYEEQKKLEEAKKQKEQAKITKEQEMAMAKNK